MLGLGVLTLVIAAIGIFVFVRSERGQKLIGAASEGFKLLAEARRAPGTDAMRAAGCSEAMVIPAAKMAELVGQIAPEAKVEISQELKDGTLVMCQVTNSDSVGPDCAEVARIYGKAAPQAPERFGVMVQEQRGGRSRCEGSYSKDGTLIEDLERPRDRPRDRPRN